MKPDLPRRPNNLVELRVFGPKIPAKPLGYVMSPSRRKHAQILAADPLALIVTNRRARKGIRQDGFKR